MGESAVSVSSFKPKLLGVGKSDGRGEGKQQIVEQPAVKKTIASVIKTQTVWAQEPDFYCDPNKNVLFLQYEVVKEKSPGITITVLIVKKKSMGFNEVKME